MLANGGSIAGTVFLDTDASGTYAAAHDVGIPGVIMTLTGTSSAPGTDAQPFTLQAVTDDEGKYQFTGIGAGSFTLTQSQPSAWQDGEESAGSPAGQVSDNQVVFANWPDDTNGTGYDFGELAILPQFVSKRLFLNSSSKEAFRNLNAAMIQQGGDFDTADGIRSRSLPSTVALSGSGGGSVSNPINKAPVSFAISPASVAENSAVGSVVGAVTAVDPDGNTPLTFGLSNDGLGTFELVGTEIRVKNNSLLDFESRDSISITVTATDSLGGVGFATLPIKITDVEDGKPINMPPSAIMPAEITLEENTAVGTLAANLFATDPEGDPITYSLTDSDTGTFEIADGNQLRVLNSSKLDFESRPTFTIIANAADTAGNSTPTTITVNLTNVNEAPLLITPFTDLAVNEDSSISTLDVGTHFQDPDAGTTLVFTATSSEASIVTTSVTGSVLTLQLQPDANTSADGPVSITVTASDGELSVSDTFSITVRPVNDAPAVLVTSNVSSEEDAGPQTVPNFVTSIASGAANEASQSVTVSVTNFTNNLFAAGGEPEIVNGELQYTAAPNAYGQSVLTIRARDDGGTENDGKDTSTTQTATITITPVNDAPTGITFASPNVSLNAAVGSTVGGVLTVVDPDSGDDYTFALNNDADGRFSLSNNRLVLANNTGLSVGQTFSVTVQATRTPLSELAETIEQDFTITVVAVEARVVTLGSATVSGTASQTAQLPIVVSETQDILGIDFAIKYDKTRLSLFNSGERPTSQTASVRLGTALTGWLLSWDVNEDFSTSEGLLVVTIANVNELPQMTNGQLLILDFDLVPERTGVASVSWIAEQGNLRSELNEGQIPVTLLDGQIQIQ
ncbi:Cadherin domain protein [Rosistilla oblonga]|uniref:cadherin domain-containing protein n=1 Tax=Rosistilla oblonga TaxID=2527990 RepID=UPI001189D1CC|nr:cadherin domain-containing protein [Rosistilla oblonga]QDV11468.1 Cadherin domain protein [Rosistilla oblonga]